MSEKLSGKFAHAWFDSMRAFCLMALAALTAAGAANRSTYINYDSKWIAGPTASWMVLDTAHQQIFTVWAQLNRVDVRSTSDYHLIKSILLPGPTAIDISPDLSTIVVGGGSHLVFLNTTTYAKVNEVSVPNMGFQIQAVLSLPNGNVMVRGTDGDSTGGGSTEFWNSATNQFSYYAPGTKNLYNSNGPMARSGDHTRVMLGDSTTAGSVQVIDGTTGVILWSGAYGGYISGLGINNDASKFAVCIQIPGSANDLAILDSSFDEIYQDQLGCQGMIFSGDGQKLYRDVTANSASYTQVLDLTTYAASIKPNYFTAAGQNGVGSPTLWQVADTTGMVYGMSPNTVSLGVPWMALDLAAGSAPPAPAVSDPVKIVAVIDNVGSSKGGDPIRLLATGVDTAAAGSVSLIIGGQAATAVTVTSTLVSLPNGRIVTATTPAGQPGLADVTLSAPGGSSTAMKGFQYAASTTIVPFSTSPNFLLYDAGRNRLYASHKDQVEVIDVAGKTALTPLTPVGGKLANSQFAGLSLSPDGNRLYIADGGAQMVHILNLASPGTGQSINLSAALGASNVSVSRVFELSTGKLLGGGGTATGGNAAPPLFLIDPSSQTGAWAQDEFGNKISAYLWNTTNQGRYGVLSADGDAPILSFLGQYDAQATANSAPSNITNWIEEAAGNEDGTAFIAGGSTPGISSNSPEVIDANFYPIGLMNYNYDVFPPNGTPSFFMDPTGALIYKAGTVSQTRGGVEIYDVQSSGPAATVVLPEQVITSYTPVTDRMMTTDATGQTIFAVTQSGITIMTLSAPPLSIGNLQPAFVQPGGGQTLTIRGTGFVSGATVSLGGTPLSTTYVDAHTLAVQTPALASAWQDVTVSLPNGSAYTAPALLQVLSTQPAPAITGLSPSPFVIQASIAPTGPPAIVTVLGQNFENYDTVQINGQPAPTVFVDSGHLQVTIPSTLTSIAGSISLTVVSPYAGVSNTMALPMVNPLPVLEDNPLLTLTPGSALSLTILGTGFVPGSVIDWNGQPLPTTLSQGLLGPTGLEGLITYSPASSLTAADGTATVTVFDPGPGGGVSNAITVEIAPPQPVIEYTVTGVNVNKFVGSYNTTPTTIDFGDQVVGTTITYQMGIGNIGTGQYTMSGASLNSGLFSVSSNNCITNSPLPVGTECSLQFSFAPTATGKVTATLTITDNSAGSPEVITLTGNGIGTPQPVVDLTAIQSLGAYLSAQLVGSEVVGGPAIPATGWIEYGTDQTLGTYTQSATWAITGDGPINQTLTNLTPGTLYAARIAVQTSGGTTRSAIHLFSTLTAPPLVRIGLGSNVAVTQTVKAGQTATWQMTADNGGQGYSGTATFACTGAPTGATCTVTPAQLAIGQTAAAFTVTVTTTGSTSALAWPLYRPRIGPETWAWCFLLTAGLVLAAGRKRRMRVGLLAGSIVIALGTVSCGGGGSSNSGPNPNATPAGNYALTVTATAGTSQSSQLLTLVVQ